MKEFWPIMEKDIMTSFANFYSNRVNLNQVNRANVVMVPKRENAKMLTDFRPISVINIIPKLIAKVLSNRLRSFLSQLISTN